MELVVEVLAGAGVAYSVLLTRGASSTVDLALALLAASFVLVGGEAMRFVLHGPLDERKQVPSASRSATANRGSGFDAITGAEREARARLVEEEPRPARVRVVGVGGAGCNAVNSMIRAGLSGVGFVAASTDSRSLKSCRAPVKVQLGVGLTGGLGAGANSELGRQAALEAVDRMSGLLQSADMVFVACGMGGGTGTGAAPVIAQIAQEAGALTVGVVTKPFGFEGARRRLQAEKGIEALAHHVDVLVTIPNDRLLRSVEPSTSLKAAMSIADDVLRQAVQGIAEIITVPGLIDRDFADVRTVMQGMGHAIMGIGVASGEHRAVEAAQQAIASPLLEDTSIGGARGLLINITGGDSVTLNEVNEAAKVITEGVDPQAQILFGAVIDPSMGDALKVTVIATGFGAARSAARPAMQEVRPPARETAPVRSRVWLPDAGRAAYGINQTDE